MELYIKYMQNKVYIHYPDIIMMGCCNGYCVVMSIN